MVLRKILRTFFCGLAYSILCTTAVAEVFSAMVPVVNGDVSSARLLAFRELVLQAAWTGGVEVRSATSLIHEIATQSSLVTSRARLRRYAVVDEDLESGYLKVRANVEVDTLPLLSCQLLLQAKNTQLVLNYSKVKINTLSGARMFGEELGKALNSGGSGFISVSDDVAPVFFLHANFDGGIDQLGELEINLLGADGSPLFQRRYPLVFEKLITKRRESIGYADLVKTTVSSAGLSLVQKVATDILAKIQCLPAVVRLADYAGQSSVRIDGMFGVSSHRPSAAFFSKAFPVAADGMVDLLRLDGQLEFVDNAGEGIHLKIPHKKTGMPYPAPGSFVLLLP